MAMNIELFKAILAMDSYNRGYNAGISFGAGSDNQGVKVGNATVFRNKGDAEAQAQGFYAIAYSYNGQTIISYRGTDENFVTPWGTNGSDLVNGYFTGGG